ncbi:MAG TPA: thioredoxin domain-containing protein [Hanamia sp.]|nr:thioredoxin domain-containing protein [Hanamia sp.]
MKKLLFILPCFLISLAGFSQSTTAADKSPEFVKNPNIPDFTIYKAPDSTVFTNDDLKKNKPTLLMIFSPECGHCQNETRELEKYIDHFKNVQILMVTWLPYSEMMAFYHDYKIASYPNITMGWDKKDFFLPYYHVQMYPDMVVYDKHGKYVNSFSGMIKLQDVVDALNK